MKFTWEKKGRIYDPANEDGCIRSHAQIPTALYLENEKKIRVYIATRPYDNLSQTTFLDLDVSDPSKILYIHDKTVLTLGKDGMFDEHGIMPNVVLKNDEQVYLYYIGWSRRDSVPYSNWAGLAISDDNGINFKKLYPSPILDRTEHELLSAATSSIIIENGIWHLWYVAGIDWVKVDGKYEQTYSVKHATSANGISWDREIDFCLPQKNDYEAITRPTVMKINGQYHMWYCYRDSMDYRNGVGSYKIGYAWSDDLKTWTREDERSGIQPSDNGWDSKMNAYPYVIKAEDKYLMFYNGNYFGKEGFGYAELNIL